MTNFRAKSSNQPFSILRFRRPCSGIGAKFKTALIPAFVTCSKTSLGEIWRERRSRPRSIFSCLTISAKFFNIDKFRHRRPFDRFCLVGIKQCDDVKIRLFKTIVIRQRRSEPSGADNRDAVFFVETENFRYMIAQIFDVIADAAHAEFAEIRQILANLRRIQMKSVCQICRMKRSLRPPPPVRSNSAGKCSDDLSSVQIFFQPSFYLRERLNLSN